MLGTPPTSMYDQLKDLGIKREERSKNKAESKVRESPHTQGHVKGKRGPTRGDDQMADIKPKWALV